jgi:hypothetical protein
LVTNALFGEVNRQGCDADYLNSADDIHPHNMFHCKILIEGIYCRDKFICTFSPEVNPD